jgi:hypothetical protein
MNLSKKTLEVLKNFATINSNFYYSGEGMIKTVSPMKNILANSVMEEDLPEFGIYDLSEFLSVLSLYRSPCLDFSEDYVDISWEDKVNTVVRFHFAAKNILTVSDKTIDIEDFFVSLKLSRDMLSDTVKSAAVLQLSDIVLKSDGITTTFGVIDKKDGNKNSHLTILNEASSGVEYEFYFKYENLKMIPNDYILSISKEGIGKFESEDVTYWVATEN